MARLVACLSLIAIAALGCGGSDLVVPTDHGPAAAITMVKGDDQTGTPGTPLADSIVVRVTDSSGNPVPNQQVVFTLASTAPGAAVSPPSATTGPNGTASAQWILGQAADTQEVVAQVIGQGLSANLTVRFTASATTEAPPPPPPPGTNRPPAAAFTPPSCSATQPCQFTDASTDSDGNVVSWSWTFGDDQTSNLRNPTNTYATSGSYSVTLTVTDDRGGSNSVTHNVTVTPFANPDTYTTQATTTLTVGFADRTLANDVGGVLLAAGLVNGSGPSHGTLRFWDVSGTFDYVPNNDGATSDTFKYFVTDEFGPGNETTVTINITP